MTKTQIFKADVSVFCEVSIEKTTQDYAVHIKKIDTAKDYTHFWLVKTPSMTDHFVIGKGYNKPHGKPGAKGEYVMWYPNGKMYFGCERTLEAIINTGLTNAFRYM